MADDPIIFAGYVEKLARELRLSIEKARFDSKLHPNYSTPRIADEFGSDVIDALNFARRHNETALAAALNALYSNLIERGRVRVGEKYATWAQVFSESEILISQVLIGLSALEEKAWSAEDSASVKSGLTVRQERILKALDGKAMRTDELAAATGIDRSDLFKKELRLLPELKELQLIAHRDDIGYYRPDAMPSGIS